MPDEPQTPVYDRDNLPEYAPGGATWADFTLREPLHAIRIEGAFQVRLPLEHSLRDEIGTLTCRDGWLAIDQNGDPFPIDAAQFDAIYHPYGGTFTAKPSEVERGMLLHEVRDKDGQVLGTIVINDLSAVPIWDFAITPIVSTEFDEKAGVDRPQLGGWLASSRTTLDVRHREAEVPYSFVGPDPSSDMLFARLACYVEGQGGSIGCAFINGEWSVSVIFGQEAEDSPMAGGAAHGIGTLHVALEQAAMECGLLK
jgi:hypothetical protein